MQIRHKINIDDIDEYAYKILRTNVLEPKMDFNISPWIKYVIRFIS